MPSFVASPAVLNWAGGVAAMTPVRFSASPAVLSWSGGVATMGPTALIDISALSVRLDRLQRPVAISDRNGLPTIQYQKNWQDHCKTIEDAFKLQAQAITELQRVVDIALAAQDTAAGAAQANAELSARVDLANSRTDPVDGLLTANSDGTVTIAAHNRVYTDTSSVSVLGGALSGFAQDNFIRVYYLDAARTGGAVSYVGTTDEVTQTGDTHVVGGVRIPLSGSPPSTGSGATPPGYVRDEGDLR